MGAQPTIIPDLGRPAWRQSLIDHYPPPWTGDAAKQPGGVLFAIMDAIAANFETNNQQVVYGFDACRIGTATDTALDLCAKDYYGNGLPRLPGETDPAYRIRILAGLLAPKVTLNGISVVLTQLTGRPPRMIQPWIAGQTAGYDWSYLDVDSEEIPGLYGDPGMRYIAAIQSILPNVQGVGASPVWGYDAGAGMDVYTGVYWISLAANFLSEYELYTTIQNAKAFGITIGLKILQTGLVSWILNHSYQITSGLNGLNVTVQQMAGPYIVLASGSWVTPYATQNFLPTGFSLLFGVPSPSGNTLNTAVIPYTVPFSALIPLQGGNNSVVLNVPPGAPSNRVVATPNWNTNVYISAVTNTTVTLTFSVPVPPGGALSTYWFPNNASASQAVAADSINAQINLPRSGTPFVLPSWNTAVGVSLLPGNVLNCTFETPAPVGAFMYWGII